MRRIVVGGLVVTMASVAVVGVVIVGTVFGSAPPDSDRLSLQCTSGGVVQANAQASAGKLTAGLTDEQRGNAALIVAIGKARGLPPLAWQVAIQAGMTESGLRSLNYGDRDSLGIFQMRPSMGWGTPEQVTDPEYAINKFYDVLLEHVPNYQQQRPGESAQDVERSAFPDRYHKWEAMAAEFIQNSGDAAAAPAAACRPVVASEAAKAAIKFALGEQGKPYEWGASVTQQGSYDCSSLMLQAYRAAGVMLPRTSREQYKVGGYKPLAEVQPGDLLFWAYNPGDPDTIHHVAMYVGDGKIVEAQQTGVPVHVRPLGLNPREGELMDTVVRVGSPGV